MIRSTFITVIALVFAITAVSEASTWAIDAAHSSVGFKIKHLMIVNVSGVFGDVSASVDYDENNIAKSIVSVTIKTASINTNNEQRDNHLRSADFFDAEKYPTITFVSKKIEKTGNGLKIIGDLTIHGVTKEITLDVDGPTPPMVTPMGDTRMGASASGKINRSDFGLTWNRILETGGVLVGDEVNIMVEVELVKK